MARSKSNKRTTSLVVNENEVLRLTMVWCGLEQETNFRTKSRECMERVVPCFENEDFTTIMMTEVHYDSIHSTRFSAEHIAQFELPGTTCAILFVRRGISNQTIANLTSFGRQFTNRNGPNWQFRVIVCP